MDTGEGKGLFFSGGRLFAGNKLAYWTVAEMPPHTPLNLREAKRAYRRDPQGGFPGLKIPALCQYLDAFTDEPEKLDASVGSACHGHVQVGWVNV